MPNLTRPRSSNLELYRIICMLMIVAHHYVVNSGLTTADGPLQADYTSGNSLFLTIFGAWGKTGINCFLMITGYFMCTSRITFRKFFKLMSQIYFYRIVVFLIFLYAGYEVVSVKRLLPLCLPVWGLKHNFVSCFIVFWLAIPFLNILIRNMTKRQHELLLALTLGFYTVMGSVLDFNISFNYVTWFCIIYFIASYIRFYPNPIFDNRRLWGWVTLISVMLAIASIVVFRLYFGESFGLGYFFVSDSNKILSVAVAVCSFLWFKNMDIQYSKVINAFGAGTFGVLLIHVNSNAMRTWLWRDTVDAVGHYTMPLGNLVLFSIGVVLAVFVICNLIDQIRIATIEKWWLKWFDRRFPSK